MGEKLCCRCKGEQSVTVKCISRSGVDQIITHIVACPQRDGKGYTTDHDRELSIRRGTIVGSAEYVC